MSSHSLTERRGAPGRSRTGALRFLPATDLGVMMAGRVLSFADVVGDEEEFFRAYFNKKVLYRPRAITGDPRQILSIADMDDIVHQEGLRSSLLRMLGNGAVTQIAAAGDVVRELAEGAERLLHAKGR